MYLNEYYCNDCGKQLNVVLDGINNKEISCLFCKSEDINWISAKEFNENKRKIEEISDR